MHKEFKRPLSMVEATMNGIRSLIINGNLSLGQQLSESYLQKSFGFSKTPIREALAQLKAEGIVLSEVHKGFRVFKMDEKDLSEFCEFRLALESQALKSAYKNSRLELVRGLKDFIKEFEKSIKENDFVREKTFPLCAYLCETCFLVQLEEIQTPEHIFSDYAYFSSIFVEFSLYSF